MDDELVALVAMLVPITMIVGGIVLGAITLRGNQRLKELAYRERLAMIEKGMVPPGPSSLEPLNGPRGSGTPVPPRALRHQSVGVLLVGVGCGLIVLLSFAAGSPQAAVGVGGGLAVLGGAFLLNSVLTRRLVSTETADPSGEHGGRQAATSPPTASVSDVER